MNYEKIYTNFIEKCKKETRYKSKDGVYYEKHHIKPMFLFSAKRNKKTKLAESDPNHKSNIILLTFREHFFAHLLLYKIYKGTEYEYSSLSSVLFMLTKKGEKIRFLEVLEMGKKMQFTKEIYSKKLSNIKKNTVCVKDATTEKMIGFVSVNDPKYISGEYVFLSKRYEKIRIL